MQEKHSGKVMFLFQHGFLKQDKKMQSFICWQINFKRVGFKIFISSLELLSQKITYHRQ